MKRKLLYLWFLLNYRNFRKKGRIVLYKKMLEFTQSDYIKRCGLCRAYAPYKPKDLWLTEAIDLGLLPELKLACEAHQAFTSFDGVYWLSYTSDDNEFKAIRIEVLKSLFLNLLNH